MKTKQLPSWFVENQLKMDKLLLSIIVKALVQNFGCKVIKIYEDTASVSIKDEDGYYKVLELISDDNYRRLNITEYSYTDCLSDSFITITKGTKFISLLEEIMEESMDLSSIGLMKGEKK